MNLLRPTRRCADRHRPALIRPGLAAAFAAAWALAAGTPAVAQSVAPEADVTALQLARHTGNRPPGALSPEEDPDSTATLLARQSEIRRTAYGVPHIRAENLRAAGYALGYAQMEDYRARVPLFLLRVRGELARWFGPDSLETDFQNRPNWLHAADGYHLLDADTRDVYDGFAIAVNRYIRLHPDQFPDWMPSDFSGIDALTTDMELPDSSGLQGVLRRLRSSDGPGAARLREGALPAPGPGVTPGPAAEWAGTGHPGGHNPDEGSNAWALAPSRTKSGKAILLRNPHLDWDAGYYEAQLTVPGVVDFYGDFRIGGPFQTIGGFNRRLGWSTTNNAPDLDEVYALKADPAQPDNILLDGASIPLRRETISVRVLTGGMVSTVSRDRWLSPLGPVVDRRDGMVYIWSVTGAGDFRLGEMWLRLMRARNLAEWKAGMRMLAKPSSNFIYADADGNIFYVWYGQIPRRPVPSGGDTLPVAVTTSAQVASALIPFDSLPQLLNPKGGYLHNENDPFHYTNLNQVLSADAFPPDFPRPELGLRSQLALRLIGGRDRLSLTDVIRRKHSMRMLLAERFKPDLLAAVRATAPTGEVAAAADLLARWDNTVAPESRGGVLFETWWRRYVQLSPRLPGDPGREKALVQHPWSPADPMDTPAGLADAGRAADAFAWAVTETERRFGSYDVSWGDVHRVRIDSVDVPVGGCSGSLGCFRVLWYDAAPDGKLVASGGDGWILAVEFTDPPRAESVLAYGESARPGAEHHADQTAMFAREQLKPVAFTEVQIDQQTVRSYHPGMESSVER